MYRTKKDIDAHVDSLISKLPLKEFTSRGYSIGKLYYEVGDYANCCRYVEQYVAAHGSNAAAHALLGQALQKLGQKKKALEEYKTSYELCPSQNSLVLNICEILSDTEENIDPGRAKYWCEKAEKMFPKHPITFQLREKLLSIATSDPQALVNLLLEELDVRPKDVLIHIRLLKFYLKNNKVEEAFTHSCKVEFNENNFNNNYEWYETVAQVLRCNPRDNNDWLFQLLLLTVAERMCALSLTQILESQDKTIFESTELLHLYDQAIESVAKAEFSTGHGEFHTTLLKHHRSQFAFIAATLLLKRGATHSWRDAVRDAEPLMLMAWHSIVPAPTASWVISAPEMQQKAARRWYSEGSYRCSQSGHYLLSNFNEKSQSFLDRISQNCSDIHWRAKLYGKIFSSRYHLEKINNSHLVSTSSDAPALILPKRSEVEIHDEEAQRAYGNSLHHFVWILLHYKEYSQFKCTTFDMLPLTVQNDANCGPESLCQLDIYAFLYCATLTSRQYRSIQDSIIPSDKPKTLPACITELLCPLSPLKWWDCVYKFCQNELGTEMTDIRATLSRGIEVVRCIDNHGIDVELLCDLGRIFSTRAKHITDIDDKRSWEVRAVLYYSSAIALLESKRNDMNIQSDKRMFEKPMNTVLNYPNTLLEECKLYVALHDVNMGEYEKAIELLSTLKSAQGLYHLGATYKNMALNENNCQDHLNDDSNLKCVTLLSKARKYAYEAHYKLNDPENKSNRLLLLETEELISELDLHLNELSNGVTDKQVKNSSDSYYSTHENEDVPVKTQSLFPRNFSSTPKRPSNISIAPTVNYDQLFSEPIERQKTNFAKRDTALNEYIEITKNALDENRILGNQIISTINSNMQNTADQFALLKISVDQVKSQIDECRKECKDVGELKKQIAELKKDISKLKKTSEQTVGETELFNLDETYTANETATTFAAQLPFTAQQVMPAFNQRLIPPFPMPPNPFQLYSQNLFNLYSQFSQPSTVPGAPPIFDAARNQVNYPGVFPTPDQTYLDVAHLVQQTIPTAPPVPVIPAPTPVSASVVAPTLPVTISHSAVPVTTSSIAQNVKSKDIPRSLPANVVITSSDPLPTCTTAPAPILSVTIPPKHNKGIPHNYQIQMPATEPTPIFGFPVLGNKISPITATSNWSQNAVFKDAISNTSASSISFSPKPANASANEETLAGAANDSHNKTRTLSEKSNTSIDNYDPCPDFKPIIPLPAEVKVTTGEENETAIFTARAKLYRFIDNQWKERGLGEMKLLKHKVTGKVRVLMRREQIHKICANHAITSYMEIKPMKNEAKAYFWVANDFADETLVLEKLCVRFKTSDTARQFYETFEKARSEATVMSKDSEVPINLTKSTPGKNSEKSDIPKTIESTSANNVQPAKTVFGGFTFSSTPSFKAVDDNKIPGKVVETSPAKVNVFSGLNFKTGPASSPLSNLFSTSTTAMTTVSNMPEQNNDALQKLNASDTVEEYEPTGEFTPVVPLPALVDTKTGEEDEIVLYEHRAKLLRFVNKEWKERGLGNIKLLLNKENPQKLRLLMRREQVMKVCCNHAVTKTMNFQKMPKVDFAVTWGAQDFSEGELTPETFCLRFKTVQACNDFIDAVKYAQSKLKDDSKATKEEQNFAKQNTQTGAVITSNKPLNSNWGDKFKPKQGSWECQQCLVRNEANVETCPACNSPKSPAGATPLTKMTETKVTPSNDVKFKFGIPQQPNSVKFTEKQESKAPVKSSWGDMLKPSAGSWECKQCFVRNESGADLCCACNSPKDPSAVKMPVAGTTIFPTSKFNFGIPLTQPTQVTNEQKTNTSSIFDGTGAHKFNFGIPSNLQGQAAEILPKIDKSSVVSNVPALGTVKTNDAMQKPTLPQKENKQGLLPTPQKPSGTATFDFVFKPKTQIKAKSPIKSPNKNDNGDESDGNEYASEDEGHHIHVTPIVPLPDKVKVVTGEEDEDELFGQRAKLFIFVSGEWKERGLGIVKILKHKQTSKLRVVMRREQVFKICLNHALTPDITYNLKEEKNWIFAANDFSEGELTVQRFCLKFKTKEIAQLFKAAVDNATNGKSILPPQNVAVKADNVSDDVEFITETQSNEEEKKKALELMLPENFFLYKNKEPCKGCRGCEDQDWKSVAQKCNVTPSAFTAPTTFSNPRKILPPNDSVYFTPDKFPAPRIGTTIGETILTQSGDITNTTKTVIQKPKLIPADSSSSIFKAPIATVTGAQITAAGDSREADPKSIFATANSVLSSNSSLFSFKPNNNSNSEAKSIFGTGFGITNSKVNDGQKQEETSIFGFSGGFTNPTPFNLFNLNEGIFTKTNETIKTDQISTFTPSNAPNYCGNGKSVWTFDPKTDIKPQAENKSELAKLLSKTNTADENCSNPTPKLSLLGSENLLSFSAFSNQPELQYQKNPDFKWEGAGQQLFTRAQKSKNTSDCNIENDTGNGGEEEYDPHYEPIVPLPDKITVTTGEEDEEKLFGTRCKLFRFNDATREWKERGVGELKILYHPEKKTYRLLFRREQVHKAVLNMLLFMDLELLPMNRTDRAWTWAGRNYAENPAGDQETLAVRFKSQVKAAEFFEKVKECVRKLQAAAAQEIREEKEAEEKRKSVSLLRLPKHLEDSARADSALAMRTDQHSPAATVVQPPGQLKPASGEPEAIERALFRDVQQYQEADNDHAENYEHEQVYYQGDDYDTYYNEKLQAAAAQEIREEKEAEEKRKSVSLLRLPKHLEDSARADSALAMRTDQHSPAATVVQPPGQLKPASGEPEAIERALFRDVQKYQEADNDHAENYEHEQVYYQGDDYDTYYNEEEESGAYFSCDCEAQVQQGSAETSCVQAHVQVVFDHTMDAPKIQLTNVASGELLAEMLVHDETEFQLSDASCSWSGTDYTTNEPIETTVTVTFPDSETAVQFYESCESCKEQNSAADADTD